MKLSWSQVEEGCRKISDTVINKKIDVIVPIVRGGMVPSVIISEMIFVNAITPIRLSTRHNIPTIWYDKDLWTQLLNTNMNILIVEDIVDTGVTVNVLLGVKRHKESLANVTVSALVLNDNAEIEIPDLEIVHAYNVQKDDQGFPWVVFPWDAAGSNHK